MEHSIVGMLRHASETFGDKGYLFEKTDAGWKGQSYAQARNNAHALAAALDGRNLKGNTAIIAEGRPSWVISELAVLIGGSISVPLSIKLQAEEIPFRINHAEVRTIVCSKLSIEKILDVWDDFDHGVALVYLDADAETLARIEERSSLKRGEGFFTFAELLEQGTQLMKDPAVAKKINDVEAAIRPETPASIGYTSGTTGNPKGITLSHGNYYANCRDSLGAFPIPFGLRMFVILPIDHAYAHTIALYAALIQQFSLYFVDARGGAVGIARSITGNMQEVNPHLMLSVPSLTGNFMQKIISGVHAKGPLVRRIFDLGLKARIYMNGTVWNRPPLYRRVGPWFAWFLAETLVFSKVRSMFGSSFQFCIGGGAFLELKQQEFFRAIGMPVYQGYGLSEASPVVSTNSIPAHKLGTSGRLLPNVACRIIDNEGHDLPIGQKGQILLKGENIMLGYWKNPEATREAIRDGWLYSGDLGFIDEDRFLHVVGREKALLIMEDGEKYSPEEIEEAIVACSSGRIQQCMLYCDHKKYVSALIVLNPDEYRKWRNEKGDTTTNSDRVDELMSRVSLDFEAYRKEETYAERFPRHWLPRTFVIVEEPFSESNGMINSTLKMVRRNIVAAHQEKLDFMYTDQGAKSDNSRNRQTIMSVMGKKVLQT